MSATSSGRTGFAGGLDRLGHALVGGHRGGREVQLLEQRVHHRAAHGRRQRVLGLAAPGRARGTVVGRRQPQRPVQVEAVPAAPVGGQARVAQAADRQRLGHRHGRQRGRGQRLQAGRLGLGRHRPAVGLGQQCVHVGRAQHPAGHAQLAPLVVAGDHPLALHLVQARRQRTPDPAHRLGQVGGLLQLLQVRGAAEHQVLLGAGGGHVEDPPLLLLVRRPSAPALIRSISALFTDSPDSDARRMPIRPSSVTRSAASSSRPSLAQVGHAHQRELQALGPVHGHQPHGVQVLGLQRRLALAAPHQVALGHEVDEAAQVAALVGLELARHPHELAHVGHPPVARGQRQQVAVVARARDRAVDQRLQRHPRRHRPGPRGSGRRTRAGARAGRRAAPRPAPRPRSSPARSRRGPTASSAWPAPPACPATARPAATPAPSAAPARPAGWPAPPGRRAGRPPAAGPSSRGRPARGCVMPRSSSARSYTPMWVVARSSITQSE